MNRAESIDQLQKFDSLALLAGVNTNDTTPGFRQVIDSALRILDFSESDLPSAEVEDADVRGYLALLDYYALKMIKLYLAPNVDISYTAGEGKVDKKRSQTFALVTQLLADAKEEVKSLGYLDSDYEIVSYNTNYLEPASSEI